MTLAENLECSRHKEIRGKASYDKYANYDAIDVPYTDAIPSNYSGMMGVPISFLDKYCPEQFEILECHEPAIALENIQRPGFVEYKSRQIKLPDGRVAQKTYHRIFIRFRKHKE